MNMLRSIRERKGLTVGQLAARASIPSRVLTEYEEGRQPIPLPHAKLLAKALWVQIEDLLPAASAMPRPAASNPSAAPPPPSPRPQAPAAAPPTQPHPSGGLPAAQGTPRDVPNGAGRPAPPMQAPQGQARPDRYPEQGQPRPGQERGGGTAPAARRPGDSRGPRPPRPVAAPPKPITEGQIEELLRLGTRLEMEQPKIEASMGKPIEGLTRVEAKEWIKRFRDMTDEATPGSKVRFGQWPGSREDREAVYLAQYRDSGTVFTFKLFNGEEFQGMITDFTPYTITIKLDGKEDLVLRKLAIAYYRQVPEGATALEAAAPKPARASRAKKPTAGDEEAPPVEEGIDSDRAGEPAAPERDNMDEDRGI